VSIPNFCRRIFNSDVCQAAKDVDASEEALADLFERIENFFKRLESYTEVPPTDAMTDMIVKIMVEVLNIFAIATKEMKQGRASVLLPGSS
jgi:ribosomal protein S8